MIGLKVWCNVTLNLVGLSNGYLMLEDIHIRTISACHALFTVTLILLLCDFLLTNIVCLIPYDNCANTAISHMPPVGQKLPKVQHKLLWCNYTHIPI